MVQFQHVGRAGVSIAEFIWLGVAAENPTAPIDVKAVEIALAEAGAIDVVRGLDKGVWSRLGPVRDTLLLVAD